MQNKGFLVIQIGCIECGVSSYPIKIVDTLLKAKDIVKEHPSTWKSEGGDGFVMIINLETLETTEFNCSR